MRVVFDLTEPFGKPRPSTISEPAGGELSGPEATNHQTSRQTNRRGRFRHGLEVEFTGTAGDFNLSNGVGKTDYVALHGSVAYRFGLDASRVQFFGLVGLGLDRLDLSNNPTAAREDSYLGPMIGFEGRIRVREWVAPYARLTSSVLEQGSFSQQFEAGLVFTPSKHTEAFVAYRRWDAEYVDAAPMGRDLDLEWRGVVLGFGLQL